MFERFTAYARRAVVTAQEEARELNHNYIGTEHILLALLRRPDGLPNQEDGIAPAILEEFGMSRDSVREEVIAKVGIGKGKNKTGHIPFTPRAKKVLELALREALQVHHNYIGTEHLLLGLIREDEGVAVQILRNHADLLALRAAVLDRLPAGDTEEGALSAVTGALLRRVRARHWGPRDEGEVDATPATDATLAEAARLAGGSPVGSHHLLLAALADPNSAAARTLASLGVDLGQARESLRSADVTGTSDEPPEEAAAPDVRPGRGRDADRRHRRPGAGGGGEGRPGGGERERRNGGGRPVRRRRRDRRGARGRVGDGNRDPR